MLKLFFSPLVFIFAFALLLSVSLLCTLLLLLLLLFVLLLLLFFVLATWHFIMRKSKFYAFEIWLKKCFSTVRFNQIAFLSIIWFFFVLLVIRWSSIWNGRISFFVLHQLFIEMNFFFFCWKKEQKTWDPIFWHAFNFVFLLIFTISCVSSKKIKPRNLFDFWFNNNERKKFNVKREICFDRFCPSQINWTIIADNFPIFFVIKAIKNRVQLLNGFLIIYNGKMIIYIWSLDEFIVYTRTDTHITHTHTRMIFYHLVTDHCKNRFFERKKIRHVQIFDWFWSLVWFFFWYVIAHKKEQLIDIEKRRKIEIENWWILLKFNGFRKM